MYNVEILLINQKTVIIRPETMVPYETKDKAIQVATEMFKKYLNEDDVSVSIKETK